MTGLCQARVNRGYEWRINNCNFTSDKGYPHGVIVSAQNRVPDKEHEFSVTRGELVLINKMMMASMERPNSKHEIYPVCIPIFFSPDLQLSPVYQANTISNCSFS